METLKNKYRKLTASAIEELKSFPTLFTYEGTDEPVRMGYIRRIKERGRSILIEYEFDDAIKPFTFAALAALRVQLDIGDWEMSRTHWALKDLRSKYQRSVKSTVDFRLARSTR